MPCLYLITLNAVFSYDFSGRFCSYHQFFLCIFNSVEFFLKCYLLMKLCCIITHCAQINSFFRSFLSLKPRESIALILEWIRIQNVNFKDGFQFQLFFIQCLELSVNK